MQPWSYPIQSDTLRQAWTRFTQEKQLDLAWEAGLEPITLRSWQRCALRLDAQAPPRPVILDDAAAAKATNNQLELITISLPLMEDIHQYVENSNTAVVLTNSAACILALVGDQNILHDCRPLGLQRGSYWGEGQLGSNALALALHEATPVQLVGAEHYLAALHNYATTAAPIHDVKGRIVGVLGIVTYLSAAASHTMGLAMAAARAIANQLQTDLYLRETNRRLAQLNTLFGAISEGVIAWDPLGRLTHFNTQAGEILRLQPQKVLGHPIHEVLTLPHNVAAAAIEKRTLREAESAFTLNGHTVHCLTSLQPIFSGAADVEGYILTLRPITRVRQLVHRLVGARATLTLDDVLGQSMAMQRIRRQARIAARGTAPVLLQGEGGVGKNPLARAIHNESDRAASPFIAINCQAIPHELMASEFLGFESGAYEGGPPEGRPSKFELAESGTLFLDEVESLTLEMQAALLHLIETGHVMRLGSSRPIAADVRIIAATSANLEQAVADGRFLSHLYYRFGVFVIDVPPLRDRIEDLPLLVERYLTRITQQRERASWIDDEAMRLLRRYPWPGNVRELEDALERAVSHSDDDVIRVQDLPSVVRSGRVLTAHSPRPQPALSLAEAEREAILRAGFACEGKMSEIAEQLGISRTTLWRKLKRYNIKLDYFKNSQR